MRILVAVAATVTVAVTLAVAAPVYAATTYTSSLRGFEVAATSTRGTFTGTASGSLSGQWAATVEHTPLSPNATITGGSFAIATAVNSVPTLVTGTFSGGSVTVVNPGAGCTNQSFAINGMLGNVGAWYSGSGTGTFIGTLIHYRTRIFTSCITYWATVSGSVTLTF